jgi:hypothetical protein
MDGNTLLRPPSQSYKITDLNSPKSGKLNPRKVTVSMRNPDTMSIIEIPLDGDLDEI